jgi:hypothetical protein
MSLVKTIRIAAILIAVIAAFAMIPGIDILLAVTGLALGFLTVRAEHRLSFLVSALALGAVAGALGPLPLIGEFLTKILANASAMLHAGAVGVILLIAWDSLTE